MKAKFPHSPTRRSAFKTFTVLTLSHNRLATLMGLAILGLSLSASVVSSSSAGRSLIDRLFVKSPSGTSPWTEPAKDAASSLALGAQGVDAPSLNIERRGHSATLLADGKVLVVGGQNSSGYVTAAEIFDPASGSFSISGNLNSPRADHTATRLSDGRVLIAGGNGDPRSLNTTEIFNPTTGAFAPGQAISVARAGHSATLFADGRILIAGGDAGGSAELLDVSSGSSTPVGSMNTARSMHSAALLQDGRVFVVGGRDADGNELSSGEIFDTPASSFSAIGGTLAIARVRPHVRVLFDGKVQVIGGSNDGSMEVYDPLTETIGAYAHVIPESDTCAGLPGQVLTSQTRAALFHNGQTDQLFDRTGQTITELPGTNQALVAGGVSTSGTVLNSASVLVSSPATITTDKLDYAPGEIATITGRGFQPGEVVRVKIHEDPHTPQERGFDITADADGSFSGTYLVQDYDLDMKFIVGARGLSSGWTAQTTFTDRSDMITKIGFIAASPTTFTVGLSNVTSSPLVVQTQNVGGTSEALNCGNTVTVTVTSSSAGGRFDTSSGGSFTSSNIVVTINSGFSNSSNIYYRDTTAGSPTLTATVTGKTSGGAGGAGCTNNTPGLTVGSSTGTLPLTVNKANSTTTVTSSNNPADPGVSVTFTATVAHSSGGAGSPTGTVTFKDGATTLGTGTLSLVSGQYQATYSTSALSIGSHSITASYGGDSNFNTSNSSTLTQTINKNPSTTTLSSSVNPSSVGQGVTFSAKVTGDVGTPTGTVTFVDTTTSTTLAAAVTLNGGGNASSGSITTLTAGSHVITATYSGSATYAVSSDTLTQTVNATAPTTLTVSPAVGTYGGTVNLSATLTQTSGGAAVSGKSVSFTLNGNSVGSATTDASGVASLSSASLSGINAGTYPSRVAASFAGDSSFVASNGTASLTVNAKALTVTPKAVSTPYSGVALINATYSDSTANYSITGFAGSETIASAGITLSGSMAFNGSTATSVKNVGTYTQAVGTLALSSTNSNYSMSFSNPTPNNYVITAKSVTPSVTAGNKTYDGNANATITNCTLSGVVGGDTTGCAASATAADNQFNNKNIGTGKAVTANNITLTNNASGNYALSSTTAATTANTSAATLTYTANTASRAYGVANPGFSGTVTGFLGSDNQANDTAGTITFTSSATTSSNVGSYGIDGSGLTANNGNYTFVQAADNATALTITAATLTYTANAANRAYGVSNPAFTGSVTGFLGSDTQANATTGTLTFTSPATTSSNVGSYAINGSGLTANNGNYTFVQAAGNATALTINAATLTYTADAANRAYGVSNPGFTGSVTGFVGTDNQANATTGTATFTSPATTTSNVGSYAINGSGLTANNGNYTFVQALGNAAALTINAATLTFTADAANRAYGVSNPGFTGSVSGFVGTDNQANATTGTLTFTSPATSSSNVGSYAINGSGLTANNGNYTFVQALGNAAALTINAATLTYTADAANRAYGASNPSFTGSVSGFAGTDNQANATTGTLTFTSPATTTSNVGSYAINGSGLTANNGNYTFVQAAGNATALTVTAAELTASIVSDPTKPYDGNANATLTSSNFGLSGLASGESFTVTQTTGTYNSPNVTSATTVTASLAPGDFTAGGGTLASNYNLPTTASGAGHITAASSTTTISCAPGSFTYTGSAITPCTATVTRVGDADTTTTVTYLTNVNVGTNTAKADASYAGDANHTGSNATQVSFSITPAGSTTTVDALTVPYDGSAHPTTATVTGVGTGITQTVTWSYSGNCSAAPVNVANTPCTAKATYAGDANHNGSYGSNTITINKRAATWTTNNNGRMYGNSDPNPLTTGSGNGTFLAGDNIGANYGRDPGSNVGTYHITATLTDPNSKLGNYYPITNTGATFTINPDPTAITLDVKTSGTNFECTNQYTATLTDPYTGGVPGVVLKLTIGTQGPVTATTNASGVATFTLTLNQTPAVVTESVGLNAAWGDLNRTAPTSPVSRSFTVNPDPNVGPVSNASTLYTGSRFFWTTSSTSSMATLTLIATIRDTGVCDGDLTTRGDITKAKVSFWISSNDGTSWTQVSSGQNLPVGLVDPADKTTGTASIISQYNLGKDKSAQLWVKVTVGGEYIMNSDVFDVPVTVAVPGQLNTMIAAGELANDGTSLASIITGYNNYFASGFFGAGNGTTSGGILAGSALFGGQVTYTKSLTNAQGQLTLMIHSYNKPDGTQDGALHTYYVKSNSIAGLALVGETTNNNKTASFSSKTNVYELVGGSKNGLDGGGVMQFMFTEPGGTYKVSTGTGNNTQTLTCPSGSNGCASVIVNKSTGGVWFTSAWGPVTTTGVPQTVEKTMKTGGTYIQ